MWNKFIHENTLNKTRIIYSEYVTEASSLFLSVSRNVLENINFIPLSLSIYALPVSLNYTIIQPLIIVYFFVHIRTQHPNKQKWI